MDIQKPPDIIVDTRPISSKVYTTLEAEVTSSGSDFENTNASIANTAQPTNLREYYLQIDTPERLHKTIKRFKLSYGYSDRDRDRDGDRDKGGYSSIGTETGTPLCCCPDRCPEQNSNF